MLDTGDKNTAIEALRIMDTSVYEVDGHSVWLGVSQEDICGVRVYSPEELRRIRLSLPRRGKYPRCYVYVTGMDMAEAVKAFGEGKSLIINFGDAYKPGGDFMYRASTREERLCRSCTLYASISSERARDVYYYNILNINPYDSKYLLLSPSVVIFRGSRGELLREPTVISVVTGAIPNLNGSARNERAEDIDADILEKVENILALAYSLEYTTVIFGADACDDFGYSERRMADYFIKPLAQYHLSGLFKSFVFAVSDKNGIVGRANAFSQALGSTVYWTADEILCSLEE